MSKGLEILKEIKSKPFSWERLKDSLDIIEKELKEYHELESMHEELAKSYNKLCQEKLEWLKQKQALEIIKEKNVDIITLKIAGCLERYNQRRTFGFALTQEEYDLLTEVML